MPDPIMVNESIPLTDYEEIAVDVISGGASTEVYGHMIIELVWEIRRLHGEEV